MMRTLTNPPRRALRRSLALTAVLVIGAACSGSGTEGSNADKSVQSPQPAPAAAIPRPGAQTSPGPAVQLPGNPAAVPTNGATVQDVHEQGKADVLR
jgi:hypothetical protein